MIYKATVKREGDLSIFLVVQAKSIEGVMRKVTTEYPEHTITDISETPYDDIIL